MTLTEMYEQIEVCYAKINEIMSSSKNVKKEFAFDKFEDFYTRKINYLFNGIALHIDIEHYDEFINYADIFKSLVKINTPRCVNNTFYDKAFFKHTNMTILYESLNFLITFKDILEQSEMDNDVPYLESNSDLISKTIQLMDDLATRVSI